MDVVVQEMGCRTALNRVRGMPFGWSLNPYRGCAHACVYCFARSTHPYLDLDAGADFSGRLFAKTTLLEVLAGELSSPRWRREEVAVGTATDPYQPLEARFRLTRGSLALLARHRTPITLITKGPMVRRDTDLLQELSRRAGATVCVSIPTVDEGVWRRTEPGTPAPRHRLLAVQHLVRAGVRAGVLLAPLLPGLSDDVAGITAAVAVAAAHGACFVEANVLRLQPVVKEHYLAFLEARHPELLPRYRVLYPGANAPEAVRARAAALVRRAAAGTGVGDRRPAPLLPPARPRPLALPGIPAAGVGRRLDSREAVAR